MKRLSLKAMRKKNQKGIDVVDALFAMIIASMIATAILQGLGNWFQIRSQTANQDAANQYAQGIIARTSAVGWDRLGFAGGEASTLPASPTVPSSVPCPTSYRPTVTSGSKTYKTVVLPSGESNPVGLTQTSVAEVKGKAYCVTTDVTWQDTDVPSNHPVNSYEAKSITVNVSWDDGGSPKSISVNSLRSPNIGESIPSGISEGAASEASPIKSFEITRAYHDGTSGRVCFNANWETTGDTLRAVGAQDSNFSNIQTSMTLGESDKLQEKCLAYNPDYAHYGLTVSDSAGMKFRSASDYQYPGSKLTATGTKLTWNTYPSLGTTKYRIMKSNSADFSSPTQVAEVTDSTYTVEGSGAVYIRVDTINSDYSVTATSNVVSVTS